MAMAVGPASGDEDEVMSAINTTPLVDVMLVLLIIFLFTIPVVTTSVPVTLPKERNEIRETKPENITIYVDASGGISRDPEVMIDINTTPLIDVMLVLLVMLIITLPIQLHSVNLNMPTGNPPPPLVLPEIVKIDIDEASRV